MIKKIAWNTFKNTGNLDTFLELKQIQNLEEQLDNQFKQPMEDKMGTIKMSGIIISENNLGEL